MAREGTTGRRNAILGLVILGHGLSVALLLRPDVLTRLQLKNTASLRLLDLICAILIGHPVQCQIRTSEIKTQ
jgi:hypothetical protein